MPVTSDSICGVAVVPGDVFPKIQYGTAPGGVYRLPAISQDLMANGTIKFFNATKGFGFITPEDGSKDVFVPAVSVTASGVSTLKPGQRISFDTEPDSKGPKAVNLKLLADEPAPRPVRENPAPPAVAAARPAMTLFYDPAFEESRVVLAALRAAGHDPRLVDYIAAPPDRDALKNLSLLLRGGDQSLVRKYDSLFLELRLDDRFISDGEFWAAIVEHPSLINGPVLATPQKARVCRTELAVKAFLGIAEDGPTVMKPKGLPSRVAATPAPAVKMDAVRKAEAPIAAPPVKAAAPKTAPVKIKAETKTKVKVEAKPPAKAKAKPAPKPKAKLVAKPAKIAKAVKKAVAKPVKKAKRK